MHKGNTERSSEGKHGDWRPPGRERSRWENDIKSDLK